MQHLPRRICVKLMSSLARYQGDVTTKLGKILRKQKTHSRGCTGCNGGFSCKVHKNPPFAGGNSRPGKMKTSPPLEMRRRGWHQQTDAGSASHSLLTASNAENTLLSERRSGFRLVGGQRILPANTVNITYGTRKVKHWEGTFAAVEMDGKR